MPVRIPNRFDADRDLDPARTDMNFEALREWSGSVDTSFTAVTNSVSTLSADVASDITALDTALTADIAALDTALSGDIAALDTVLSSDISTLQGQIDDNAADIVTNTNAITTLNIVQNAMFVGSNSAATVANTTNTNLPITTEAYDFYGWHSGTSHVVTPNVAGYYRADAMVATSATGGTLTRFIVQIWVNGSTIVGRQDVDGIAGYPRFTVSTPLFYLNGSTDNVSTMAWQNSGASRDLVYNFSLQLVNS